VATIILAGGQSTRMGRDKAGLELRGSTILQALAARFGRELGPVIVAARRGQKVELEGASVVRDVHPGCGPLGGLHAGLEASPDDENLLVACDMPFADPELGAHLLSLLDDHDAVVPLIERGPEPLFAAYGKSCLPQAETSIGARELSMRSFLDRIDTVHVLETELSEFDPDLRSFLNINTPEDYEKALTTLDKLGADG